MLAGRPRTSSRATIEDAAAELFLENSFAGTTIDQITQRAGVSRATFFNYFAQKSDLLWVEADEAIAALDAASTDAGPERLRATILEIAGRARGDQVPLVLSQQDVMGPGIDLAESGLIRVAALARVFARALDRTDAFILAGAVSAGWIGWARAGIGRRPLESYLATALDRAFAGIRSA